MEDILNEYVLQLIQQLLDWLARLFAALSTSVT
jgi:hypothetical protein